MKRFSRFTSAPAAPMPRPLRHRSALRGTWRIPPRRRSGSVPPPWRVAHTPCPAAIQGRSNILRGHPSCGRSSRENRSRGELRKETRGVPTFGALHDPQNVSIRIVIAASARCPASEPPGWSRRFRRLQWRVGDSGDVAKPCRLIQWNERPVMVISIVGLPRCAAR